VASFIKNCSVYQAIKTPNHKPYGLLQPLPTPEAPWLEISMDFITNLSSSKGKMVIWVIVDRRSKFSHFLALPTHYTTSSLASIFMREIYHLHGLPKTIVFDRAHCSSTVFGQKYSSRWVLKYFIRVPATHKRISYLRAFVFYAPTTWQHYLYLAKFSYNTNFHSY
jgi:hypothetical protein